MLFHVINHIYIHSAQLKKAVSIILVTQLMLWLCTLLQIDLGQGFF